jgi:hypothetical protein
MHQHAPHGYPGVDATYSLPNMLSNAGVFPGHITQSHVPTQFNNISGVDYGYSYRTPAPQPVFGQEQHHLHNTDLGPSVAPTNTCNSVNPMSMLGNPAPVMMPSHGYHPLASGPSAMYGAQISGGALSMHAPVPGEAIPLPASNFQTLPDMTEFMHRAPLFDGLTPPGLTVPPTDNSFPDALELNDLLMLPGASLALDQALLSTINPSSVLPTLPEDYFMPDLGGGSDTFNTRGAAPTFSFPSPRPGMNSFDRNFEMSVGNQQDWSSPDAIQDPNSGHQYLAAHKIMAPMGPTTSNYHPAPYPIIQEPLQAGLSPQAAQGRPAAAAMHPPRQHEFFPPIDDTSFRHYHAPYFPVQGSSQTHFPQENAPFASFIPYNEPGGYVALPMAASLDHVDATASTALPEKAIRKRRRKASTAGTNSRDIARNVKQEMEHLVSPFTFVFFGRCTDNDHTVSGCHQGCQPSRRPSVYASQVRSCYEEQYRRIRIQFSDGID